MDTLPFLCNLVYITDLEGEKTYLVYDYTNDFILENGNKSNTFKVNPNTICKAMQILEDKKIIYTERTNGKFVTMDSSIIKDYKKDIFNEMVSSFLEELQSMGYSKEEIIKKIMEVK